MTQESVLARYKVLHEVGRGAMSTVYAARDRTTGAVIALKRLDPALFNESDAQLAGRFLKQARSAQVLKHCNIVDTHGAGEAGGTVYVAMEMLEGESLRTILDKGPLPIGRAIRIAREVGCGLAYAHLQGVVHGGIKPSNVIVLSSGVAKITDFFIGQAAPLSEARSGCLNYMSPEQVRGVPVDHRCDVFSLGALFYEMLTARTPFQGGSPKEILEKVLHAKPPLPSELNPHVSRALDAIVFSMIAAQAAGRMPGVPILLRELQRLEEGLGLGSGTSARNDEPAAPVPPAVPTAAEELQRPERQQPEHQHPERQRPERQQPERPNDRKMPDYHEAIAIMERESRTQRSSRSRPAIFAAFALAFAALGIGVAGFLGVGVTGFMDGVGLAGFVDDWMSPGKQRLTASRLQKVPAAASAASRPAAPAQVAEVPRQPMTAPAPDPVPPQPPTAAQPAPRPVAPPQVAEMAQETTTAPAPEPVPAKPLAAQPSPLAKTETSVDRAAEQPAPAGAAPARQLTSAVQPTAQVKERQPGGTARLVVAVSPRGEIYIDGKHHGTTPPITTLDLEPGMRQIEIRSGSRKPYLTYMIVQPGDVRRIRHDFNAKPSGPKTAKMASTRDPISGYRQ
jgi:serine/threonine protein kinase